MTIKKKSKYFYSGPVRQFTNVLSPRWEAATWAVSESQALSNLSWRYKKEHGMTINTILKLNPDYICELSTVDEDGYVYYDTDMRRMIDGSS